MKNEKIERVIENQGVRATTIFEVIDRDKYAKTANRLIDELGDETVDVRCKIDEMETTLLYLQAEKFFDIRDFILKRTYEKHIEWLIGSTHQKNYSKLKKVSKELNELIEKY